MAQHDRSPAPAPSEQASFRGVQRLGDAALRLRRMLFGVGVAGAGLVAFTAIVGTAVAGGPVVTVAALALVALAIGGGVGWWYVGAEFRSWGWLTGLERLEVRHGVVVHREAIVPLSRVQHVSTNAGPLQRAFGLVRLDVHTAGAHTPTVTIRDLRADVADALRACLLDTRAISPAAPPPPPPTQPPPTQPLAPPPIDDGG